MKRMFLLLFMLPAVFGMGQFGDNNRFSGVYRVDQFAGATADVKLQACVSAMGASGGTCDARSLGNSTFAASITVANENVHILLPCATITTAYPFIVSPGVRNTRVEGCGYQGASKASGTAGGTVWNYTGTGTAFQVGDSTYAQDTAGFSAENFALFTANAGSAAKAMAFYRTQEIDLRGLLLNGGANTGQSGLMLDGTGNYAGGNFSNVHIEGYGASVVLKGHVSGSAVDDYANASTFTKLHVDCPVSGGSPIVGTIGVDIQGGDGNTFAGGDIEGCATVMHFGANAVNNTVAGLRNENSTVQYQADSGSSFNAVFSGGTFYTGQLVDNGSRNSFWDAFHRTVNGINGDWYASQQDATVTNHLRLGIGAGNVRGLQWESQVDLGTSSSQYNWLWGLTDGTGGSSNWIFQDVINNAIRLQLGQLNSAGGNNQSALNAAGTGNVCFNCSANAGTGGVAFGSGGASPSTVGTWDASGNTTQYGYHRFMAGSTEAWRLDCASTSVCYLKSMTPTANAPHITAYNGAGTDIGSEGTAAVTVNNKSTSGTGGFTVYEGGVNYNTGAFHVGSDGSIVLPQIHSTTGTRYLCVDSSGNVTASATACSGT